MALLVKCRKCSARVAATGEDTPGVASDGTPVLTASCGGCGAKTVYRRPGPVPAGVTPAPNPLADLDFAADRASHAPAREVQLPAIVLKAAWWVRMTLSVFWVILATLVALNVAGFAFGYYFMTQKTNAETHR